ncbi:MAG: hypothetical protein CBC02_008160 [Flavobacteriaceae bacterium TMED42]|nr:MAG: hypothetical protein CBC02_008160 [Flavobacteriaceae bacterium TMED42]
MSKNKGKLPDFLVCGFQKCATSALAQNLDQHPKIQIARTDHELSKISNGKEINFFSQGDISTHYMGIDWYKSHFKNDDKCWGEVSPNYSSDVEIVLQHMKKNNLSSTKFVFSLRNPIYRAFSAYNHYMQLVEDGVKWGNWNHKKSFIYNIENSRYTFIRNYFFTIDSYIKCFGKNKIHLIIQERLNSDDFQMQYDNLFEFLEIRKSSIKNKQCHKRNYDRAMTQKEKDFLYEFFKKDTEKLFNLIGYEIKEWTEFC